jgi:Tfp pilus assembly protein FimT
MGKFGRQEGYTLIDTLVVVGLIATLSAIAVPVIGTASATQRLRNDAEALTGLVSLAKMRASSTFTRARVRVNTADNTFVLERWDKTSDTWVREGSTERLSSNVQFAFGTISTPPPNTQTTIGLSPQCRTGVDAGSSAIGNTACIVFNSRGLPVDGDGALFGGHALYVTDGSAVYATTVTATPRIRLWWTGASAANWRQQQ